MTISPTHGKTPLNLLNLMADAEKASTDARLDTKIRRQSNHNKQMSLLDGSLGKLEDQQAQTKKAGWFNFIVGMTSNFLNMATQVLNFVLPGVGPAIANIVNSGLQGMLEQLSQINPYQDNAAEASIESQKLQKMAQEEQYQFNLQDEKMKALDSSRQIQSNRLEKALQDLQKTQEASVRI